jgi:sulfur carrier protein
MKVIVNGTATDMSDDATVVNVLEHLGRGPEPKGVAVAINGEVVPKTAWTDTLLQAEDRVEVLTAVGGG